jgi:hypothetical protein
VLESMFAYLGAVASLEDDAGSFCGHVCPACLAGGEERMREGLERIMWWHRYLSCDLEDLLEEDSEEAPSVDELLHDEKLVASD